MILTVKTTPNAPKTEIKRFENGILYMAVAAPAEKGEANDVLVRFLAKFLQIPVGDIKILSGKTARMKKIKLPFEEAALRKLF
jgi:uncharacterized protein (TIGR00251 family)